MQRWAWLAVLLFATWPAEKAHAVGLRPCLWRSVDSINKNLHGSVVDFTYNHRGDHRIPAPSLCGHRDMYVYVPPCYDPSKKYPAMLYLHGIAQDEVGFLRIVHLFDRAMACGQLPHMIIAAPDGTVRGMPSITNAGSFYINSKAGRFEDFIIQDAWNFVCANFPVRPEREHHILAGASMGGYGAYNLGIKHRDKFKVVAGMFPPLHLRYCDCHGRYFGDYDPNCLGIRERPAPHQPVARFYGVITIREKLITRPLYGWHNPDTTGLVSQDNPYEMIDSYDLKPGELDLFVGYGKRDEFNLDAQIEAFVDKARCKGIEITSISDPNGRHDTATGERLFPDFCAWLSTRVK